jgi:ATP-binding cassette, subfamily B, multidrug efflux pump
LYLRFVGRGYRIPQLVNSIQSGGAAYARIKPLLAPALGVSDEPALASFDPGRIAGLGIAAPGAATTSPTIAATGPVAVSLEAVTMRYPGAARVALDQVTLNLPRGALVAVTGPVGSGKSALARALIGLYPLESGQVRWDGRPLVEIPAQERAARMGYLPQDPYLFSGTVAENMTLGNSAPATTLQQAAEYAALGQDLRAFPAGLATEIGELGIRVSGGQRQRIALARALAACYPATPGLLVLDDPFSAVDVDTETEIIAALRQAFGPTAPPAQQATILLCSHRLAAFPQADQVVVLDAGRIIEQGAHAALIAANGLYARIYRAQHTISQKSRAPVGETA